MSMTAATLIHVLAGAPLFASRAFLTAFLTALTFRFGPGLPLLQDTELVATLAAAPPWFTHDVTLIALAVAAVAEAVAERNPDLRAFFAEFEAPVKGLVALAISLGLLDAQSASIAAPVLGVTAGAAIPTAGAAAVGGVTWGLASVRRALLRPLEDLDMDDALGLRGIVGLVEEGTVVGGLAMLIVAPMAAAVALTAAAMGVSALRAWSAGREEAARVSCGSCGARHHASAVVCPGCGEAHPSPRKVGFLGASTDAPAPEAALHSHALLMRRRCPQCASRLVGRAMSARCPECERTAFANEEALATYVAGLHTRLGVTLGALAVMSFIPVLGMIPALILIRLSVVAPLRSYTPALAGVAARWGDRITTLVLLLLQPVPILGAAMMPLIGWKSWALHRAALERSTT